MPTISMLVDYVDRPISPPPPELSVSDRQVIEVIRCAVLRARCSRSADPFHACEYLSLDHHSSTNVLADGLVRLLGQVSKQRTYFYRPGTYEVSFDEAWVSRLASSLHAAQLDSVEFLLRSRIGKIHHRKIVFLLSGIAKYQSDRASVMPST